MFTKLLFIKIKASKIGKNKPFMYDLPDQFKIADYSTYNTLL